VSESALYPEINLEINLHKDFCKLGFAEDQSKAKHLKLRT